MSGPALRVSGGAGGTSARLDDLDRVAGALGGCAAGSARSSLEALGLAASPTLAVSAVLDPAGAHAARGDLAVAALGLQRLAARVGGLGAAVGGAAAAYRGVDGATALAWQAARVSLLHALAPPPALVVGALGAGAVVLGGALVVTTAVPVLSGRATPAQAWAEGRRVGAGVVVRVAQGVGARVVAAVPLALRDDAVEGVVAGTGVAAPVIAEGILRTGAGLGAWGATTATVRRAGPPVTATPAAGAGDLLRRVHALSPRQGAAPGAVRVDRITRPGHPTAAVVHLPATQQWFPTRGTNPFDGETNVRSLAGRPTAGADGVVRAMRAAGVGRRDPVLLVGYSQGGLTAAQLAADPAFRREFTPRVVLAAGSPIAHAPVPDDVTVLALEHEGDYVHALDGAQGPDRPSWTTVGAHGGDPAHSAPGYAATGDLVDASDHPSLRRWREDAAPFLAGGGPHPDGAQVTSTTWVLRRDP